MTTCRASLSRGNFKSRPNPLASTGFDLPQTLRGRKQRSQNQFPACFFLLPAATHLFNSDHLHPQEKREKRKLPMRTCAPRVLGRARLTMKARMFRRLSRLRRRLLSAIKPCKRFPAEVASRSLGEDAPLPAALEQLPPAAVPQLNPIPRPFTSVTSLHGLEGIEPIAEALIKTLAGKARTGRLDELRALELLQQVVLL